MNVELFWKLLDKEIVVTDHEGHFIPGGREFSDIEVFSIHDLEWESSSGSHKLTTDLYSDFWEPGFTDFIARPVADIYIEWGAFRVRKLPNWNLLPQWLQQFLERLDGFSAHHSNYDLAFLLPTIGRAGFGSFAWRVNDASKVAEILIVAAPRTEREAAEWFAEWYSKALARYLAKSLVE